MNLSGKVSVITGSASGIGKQIAERFIQAGSKVVIADLNLDAAIKTAKEMGPLASAVAMDVTKEEDVQRGFSTIAKMHGRVDVLVSNAGIQHIDRVENLSFGDWKKVLAVHLDGAFLTTKEALKLMYANQKGGSIIYIGSVHSKEASPLKAPYVTAKHGLEGLCKVVAKEGASNHVRANIICPGFVRTPLVEKQIPEQAKALHISEEAVVKTVMLKDTVDGEFTTTDDVASVALFFASFESQALTGQSMVVSHGWFMQ